jgi:protoporphyrin/coproporphyrin ferrochelatase
MNLTNDTAREYDAFLLLSFGGPEKPEDVIPFLQNVAGGHNIPAERLEAVAQHYYDFGGVSPINGQNRALMAALQAELKANGPDLPIYFGNRNWHPFVTDTVRRMAEEGVKRAVVFVTSAFSSYSGCRQYLEDLSRACAAVGDNAPVFDKLRGFYNHPGFIQPMIEKTCAALERFERPPHLIFTAHSLPLSMVQQSDYAAQLAEACQLVAAGAGRPDYRLVYQSRSGSPHSPWLEPDICDTLRQIRAGGAADAVIVPIGFISDHMEVLYDLDTQAMQVAAEIDLRLVRAETVGTHPQFVAMIRELILERMTANLERRSLGSRGPNHDNCPPDCCGVGAGRPSRT